VSLPTFVTDEPFSAPSTVTLGEEEAHHMRVRRLETGSRVMLLDGLGRRGEGVLTQLAKRHATVSVDRAEDVLPPAPIHLLLPVADRDRMLWLAEKATELGVASWRPVLWKRSKNVTPRGEGTVFQQKARARMVSALQQSGGAWLPVMFPDASVEQAIESKPDGVAVVLDADAPPMLHALVRTPTGGTPLAITIAVGPEGGFEPSERAALEAGGFFPASLGANVLRFETAAVAGIAAARAALDAWGAEADIASEYSKGATQ
jgi:16S rRNA (uracil1498-N3)-methyltransferase